MELLYKRFVKNSIFVISLFAFGVYIYEVRVETEIRKSGLRRNVYIYGLSDFLEINNTLLYVLQMDFPKLRHLGNQYGVTICTPFAFSENA